MLEIAIIEDQLDVQRDLEKILDKYSIKHGLDITLNKFSSAEEFLENPEYIKSVDMFLLDIYLGEILGIELAKIIRSLGCTKPIIFLTSSKDFALEAFSVNASQYLLKPVDETQFVSALDKCIDALSKETKNWVILKTELGEEKMR